MGDEPQNLIALEPSQKEPEIQSEEILAAVELSELTIASPKSMLSPANDKREDNQEERVRAELLKKHAQEYEVLYRKNRDLVAARRVEEALAYSESQAERATPDIENATRKASPIPCEGPQE